SLGMVTLVLLLFYTQPQPSILQDESFTRNYKEGALEEVTSQKLAYNSYYVAGVNDSLIYLGNSTGFTHGVVWNFNTNDTIHISLQLPRSEEHTSELQSRFDLVCRLLLEKK